MRIITRYRTHPGSNNGAIRATAQGRQVTPRYRQDLSVDDAHRVAAVQLASRLGPNGQAPAVPFDAIGYGDLVVPLTPSGVREDGARIWETLEPWPADEARKLAAIARRLLADHGDMPHEEGALRRELAGTGYRADEMAREIEMIRENCGACVLAGYGDDEEQGAPIGPNYAGWPRVYLEAGRTIPNRYADAFRVELAGAPYAGGAPNYRYADAIRRDILTFGGAR